MKVFIPVPIYGPGIHQFILDEMELGARVAMCFDEEATWLWTWMEGYSQVP